MHTQAQTVIIGGGIVGCSIAYHLTLMGQRDVLVIDKGELTSGSTWHAAGLVGQLRSNRNITRMLKYSVELYQRLEKETEQATGWKGVGGLRLASSKARLKELQKGATTAKSFGMEMHLLSPQEAYDLFPLMSMDNIEGAAFLPGDGYVDPSSVTFALAKGARMRGARFQRNTRVTGFVREKKSLVTVETDQGDVKAETVVLASGMWTRELGRMAGVSVPLIPVQHQYLVTDDIANKPSPLPTMRDPDNLVYYKEEMGGLVMGGYEPDPKPWSVHGIPHDFGQELLEPDFEHFETLSTLAMKRTPVLEKVGVRKLINGPESFTPDGNFIMGKAPELQNVFVAAGFNAHGIAAGGGAGKMMAEWILEGQPSLNMWSVDIRRFGQAHESTRYVSARTSELYGKHYTMSWPHEEHESARGLRKSPLYERLLSQGACFGAKFGWERPNWFAPKEVTPKDEYTFDQPNWFPYVGAEHEAIRERVGLIDQTSFSKIEVQGAGALSFLQRVAANNIDHPPGKLTYTQFCNERGGIESDLTIGRLDDNHFYIVTGTSFGTHDLAWLRDHLTSDDNVVFQDVTSAFAVINLCGPKARDVLERVSHDDVSHEGFPFGTVKKIHLGQAPVRALRITYVGELGWELHLPVEFAGHVYDELRQAGADFGVINAGYRAIESLRLEKGYRYWSTDISPDNTPFEAGLGFAVDLKKENFVGKEALVRAKEEGPQTRLACFTVDSYVPLTGGETIIRDGKVLGVATSGGYGYTVKKSIVYGYVPTEEFNDRLDFEIEVFGQKFQAQRHKGTLFDPKRARILI